MPLWLEQKAAAWAALKPGDGSWFAQFPWQLRSAGASPEFCFPPKAKGLAGKLLSGVCDCI